MNVFTQWIKRVFKRQHEPLLSQEETNALIKDVTTDYLKTAVSIVLRTVPHTTLDGKPNPRWIMGVAPGFPDYDVEALIGSLTDCVRKKTMSSMTMSSTGMSQLITGI